MKVVCQDGLARIVAPDDAVLQWGPDRLRIGPVDYMNFTEGSCAVFAGVEDVPADFATNLYFFDGAAWTPNPDEPRGGGQ